MNDATPRAMGGHHSAAAMTTVWLTPPHVIDALGSWQSFDLDPCAAPAGMPWRTAAEEIREADANGLSIDWDGRVWLNPPYTTAGQWLERLERHGNGSALIFARTETDTFFSQIWERAHGLLFIRGRLHFHRPTAIVHPRECGGRITLGRNTRPRRSRAPVAGNRKPTAARPPSWRPTAQKKWTAWRRRKSTARSFH